MEFVLTVQCGMAPSAVLRAGTIIAAEVLGSQSVTGSIEVGKFADLIATKLDPTKDISTLLEPTLVVKGGDLIRTKVAHSCSVESD